MYDFIPAYEIILHIMYLYVNIAAFNPIHASGSFYTPWKHQKIRGFLMFPGVLERDQWHEMG